MWSGQELKSIFQDLQSKDPKEKALTLRVMLKNGRANKKVIPYLKALLDDTSPCLMGIPPRYGEIRWLAYYALGHQELRLGLPETQISRFGWTKPMTSNELYTIEREAGINIPRGNLDMYDSCIKIYRELRRRGRLPLWQKD